MKQAFILVLAFFVFSSPLHAQDSRSLSVTPPLFQLSVLPGDTWQSSVRVVNTNEYPLTVYAEVVNFMPQGESGQGRFVPVVRDDNTENTLAEWIELSPGPYIISGGETGTVAFTVNVPDDAAPGGHFAAVLITTEPPKSDGTIAVLTTQTVASLFFLRVEGDVIERGDIREFTVRKPSLGAREAEFSLRFENKGNVHLQPRGDIVITNMWGTERGIIPINQRSHYGNVLPASIRDFRFTWTGEGALTDIGRYKAIATIAYGEDGIKSVTRTSYFWIIPVKGALITLGCLLVIILGIVWMVRRYVRHMLLLAGIDPDEERVRVQREKRTSRDAVLEPRGRVSEPLRRGVDDFTNRLRNVSEFVDIIATLIGFVVSYARFFISLVLLIVGFILVVTYVSTVSDTDTEYEVRIEEGENTTIMRDEDIEAGRN